MAQPTDVLDSLRDAINAVVPCEVGKPSASLARPYVILNFLPVTINESGLRGGTEIIDLYITMAAVGANKAQSQGAMVKALDVVASSWTNQALLGPPEATPGAHLPQEEGTWRCDSTVKLRMQ
jgi:hypothetical protein